MNPIKQKEELIWIDGIFLKERPVIKGYPVLGKVIAQHPTDEEIKAKKGSSVITLAKESYAVGDEFYARIIAVNPEEKDYKVGDLIIVPSPGTIVKFCNTFMEVCATHSILHKLN